MWKGQLQAPFLAERLRQIDCKRPRACIGLVAAQLQECLPVFCSSLAHTNLPWDCRLIPCNYRVRTNLLSCGFHCCWAPLLIFQVRWISFLVFKSNYGNKRLLSAPWQAAIRALILSMWAQQWEVKRWCLISPRPGGCGFAKGKV